jgi:NTP pyrophosphatase (non-canonical NTP hydrolase)
MEHSDRRITIQDLKDAVRKFVEEREWEKYHTPRNLAESISIEASELLELFQWSLKEEETPIDPVKLADELADVLVYCLSLANATGIDIVNCVLSKLKRNEEKYPTERYRGTYSKPGRQ